MKKQTAAIKEGQFKKTTVLHRLKMDLPKLPYLTEKALRILQQFEETGAVCFHVNGDDELDLATLDQLEIIFDEGNFILEGLESCYIVCNPSQVKLR